MGLHKTLQTDFSSTFVAQPYVRAIKVNSYRPLLGS
jgi:hypothetical protein